MFPPSPFPPPTCTQLLIPGEKPLADDVDFEHLARHEMSAGNRVLWLVGGVYRGSAGNRVLRLLGGVYGGSAGNRVLTIVVSIHLECFVAHEFEECLAHPVLLSYLYM